MANKEGWAWGLLLGSTEWLTILGSAYRRPVFAETPETAVKPDVQLADGYTLVLARVRAEYHGGVSVSNEAYRILEMAE